MKTMSIKSNNNMDTNDLIKLEEIINLVNTTPNDMDLGKLIRELINDEK
jgi:hypothetical protein